MGFNAPLMADAEVHRRTSASGVFATGDIVRQAWALRRMRLILLAALVLRSVVAIAALQHGTTSALDSPSYVQPAKSLVASGQFDSNGAPELSRTPGYPLVLAVGELAGNMVGVTLAIQVVLGCLTAFGVAALALAMGANARVAIIASAIYAIEPSSIIYVSKILTETLFTTLVTGLLVAFTAWIRGGGKGDAVAAGLFLAAGCFARPILYYAPVVLALVAAVAWRRRASTRAMLAQVTVFFVAAAVPIAGWRARNIIVAGYDRFAAITDVNLLQYRAAGAIARRSARPIEQVQAEMRRQWNADSALTALGRVPRGRQRAALYYSMRARATAIIAHDPKAVLADAIAGVGRMLLGRDTSEWSALLGLEPMSPAWYVVRVVLTVLWLPTLALALLGIARGDWDWRALAPGVVLGAYLIGLAAGPEAYSRFRLAIVPGIAVLAACGCIRAWTWVNGRRARQAVSA